MLDAFFKQSSVTHAGDFEGRPTLRSNTFVMASGNGSVQGNLPRAAFSAMSMALLTIRLVVIPSTTNIVGCAAF